MTSRWCDQAERGSKTKHGNTSLKHVTTTLYTYATLFNLYNRIDHSFMWLPPSPVTEMSRRELRKSHRSQRKTTLKRITIQLALAHLSTVPASCWSACASLYFLQRSHVCVEYIQWVSVYVHVAGGGAADKHLCLKAFFFPFYRLFWVFLCLVWWGEVDWCWQRGGGGGLMRGLSCSFRPSRWQRALWRAGLGEVNSYYGWSLVAETSEAITYVRRTQTHERPRGHRGHEEGTTSYICYLYCKILTDL